MQTIQGDLPTDYYIHWQTTYRVHTEYKQITSSGIVTGHGYMYSVLRTGTYSESVRTMPCQWYCSTTLYCLSSVHSSSFDRNYVLVRTFYHLCVLNTYFPFKYVHQQSRESIFLQNMQNMHVPCQWFCICQKASYIILHFAYYSAFSA